jgi:succinate dehydrogenase / fumarate reductase flavoprotein subunit
MQKNVGVFRTENNLINAIKSFDNIKQRYNNSGVKDKSLSWNIELQEYLELGNMIISAESTIYSALWRRESRGAHFRSDYPTRNDKNFLYHTIYLNDTRQCAFRGVRKTVKDIDFLEPSQRNY